jgi:hypothetical protein
MNHQSKFLWLWNSETGFIKFKLTCPVNFEKKLLLTHLSFRRLYLYGIAWIWSFLTLYTGRKQQQLVNKNPWQAVFSWLFADFLTYYDDCSIGITKPPLNAFWWSLADEHSVQYSVTIDQLEDTAAAEYTVMIFRLWTRPQPSILCDDCSRGGHYLL